MNKIVIAGAGVFGTALAERLSENPENHVTLYTIESSVVEDINSNHQNRAYFPSRHLRKEITASGDAACMDDADAVFLVIPSKAIEGFCASLVGRLREDALIINMAKGFSNDGRFLPEVIPFRRVGCMKGPTFAVEVLNGLPSALTYGGTHEDYLWLKGTVLADTGIITDYTADMRAAELLSILKNMYAIAIGIISGRYNSPNVDFIMVTKAVNEMKDLLLLYGCEEQTIFNYCGIGDLGLTSLNDLSRNRTLGLLIGKGFANDTHSGVVIEGMKTIKVMGELIIERHLEDKFTTLLALYDLIYGSSDLNQYIVTVLS
ncbi:MAG: NAD(P)-binding domain-containing protein [Spirochaetia bacterium]|nr:NAD(P)-binding domain-containing protein [Spirochaetia bacterium]